jgi:broad specificity phosphatase PhoE
MPQLFLVRHCEPALTGVLLGQCDPPLSKRGREQAAAIFLDVAIVYTSPLCRARETAELIARGARIEVVDELKEISYGSWDGRRWAEIEAEDPELAARKHADWRNVAVPGAELWNDFETRVRAAFAKIGKGSTPAAVVAHAGVLHVIAAVDLPYGGVHEL